MILETDEFEACKEQRQEHKAAPSNYWLICCDSSTRHTQVAVWFHRQQKLWPARCSRWIWEAFRWVWTKTPVNNSHWASIITWEANGHRCKPPSSRCRSFEIDDNRVVTCCTWL